jgi:lipopolysaccharide export system permease protein
MIKIIDKYILKSFLGPFVVTFFIALLILLIQFLWKYIEDLVGKGLEWWVIAKLLFYASANMIPLALPLATLLSSIMLYGNLGERFELAALKSAGVSMFRFMRSTIMVGVFITVGAFMFSNYVLPTASLKFWTTLIDITRQKPALNIKPNEFYNEIENYSILIGGKAEDNVSISDITIYEEGQGTNQGNVLIAEGGQMLPSGDQSSLILKLRNGKQYEELKSDIRNKSTYEHVRMEFGEWEKALDLSGFKMQESSEDLYRDHYKMMNIGQLTRAVDTLQLQAEKKGNSLVPVIGAYYLFTRDTSIVFDTANISLPDSLLTFTSAIDFTSNQRVVIQRSLATVRNISNFTRQIEESMKFTNNKIAEHQIEWHRKFTLSVACLLFLFIGAPLGAIIRKGGFGLPVIFSIIIFIIYYVLTISGEKMADQQVITPFFGMWLGILVIFPFSILLTQKAKNDSPVFNRDWYANQIARIRKLVKK